MQNLGYYTLNQIQALNYVEKTTSSSWTSNALISLSTEVQNQEVLCNFSKRSGLNTNNPSPNNYAQANAANIELWDYSDSAGLAGAGGFHFNTNSDRLAVANIPSSSGCFNHHLDVKCRDFYLNFRGAQRLHEPHTGREARGWKSAGNQHSNCLLARIACAQPYRTARAWKHGSMCVKNTRRRCMCLRGCAMRLRCAGRCILAWRTIEICSLISVN